MSTFSSQENLRLQFLGSQGTLTPWNLTRFPTYLIKPRRHTVAIAPFLHSCIRVGRRPRSHIRLSHCCMPPAYSRLPRSANADETPRRRGQRTPRGQGPYHTPRGGRSEYTDRHRDRNRESGSIREKRDNLIEQGLCQVLRKQGGVQTERDHDFPLQDHAFEIGPRHLSYLFRHTDLLHEDGSLSLHEMINHVELPEKSEQCTTVAMTD